MEKIDPDISRWVLEFLLRSSVPDSLILKTLTVLPFSGADSRLRKTLLLRTLQSQLFKASLTETTLQILETLEEIDRNDAIPASDAMRGAYCAVAIECTVKYLSASPDDPAGEYLDAVRRIWRGRLEETESGHRALFSGEMARWRHDIEAALNDPKVSEILANLNTRREALNKLNVYLKEAWKVMGPSFLDSVATMSKAKGLRPEGVCEIAMRDGGLEGSEKEKRDSIGSDRSESDNVVVDDDGGACCGEDVTVPGENQFKEQLKERVGVSIDANQEMVDLSLFVFNGCGSVAQRDKAIQKDNLHSKRKYSALRSCQRGVKISGVKKVMSVKPLSRFDPVPSPEDRKVQESLKASSLELRASVKDPLPDALHKSEVVKSELATKNINLEQPIENQGEYTDVADPKVCMSIVPYQPSDANLGYRASVNGSNNRRSNLMERRTNAHTYEWDDSIDNMPQGGQPRKKKRRWTSLEEETLRAGVKMFGEGNWATIRSFYSNIFENRRGVDLKDKWRNMIR